MILAELSHITRQQSPSDYEYYYYEDDSSELVSNKNDNDASSKVFSYAYTVNNIDDKLFFNKTERGDEDGRVAGAFSVLRADGKLMTIEYTASKEKGFRPVITIVDKIDDVAKQEDDIDVRKFDENESYESYEYENYYEDEEDGWKF